ncbi:zinc ribbon domain-containing protein [Thermoflexus hugenholtzii]
MSRNWIGLLIGALVLLVLLVGALGLLAGPAWGWGWGCPGCPMMGRWGWGGMGWGFGLWMMLLGLLLPLLFFGLIIAAVVWGIQQVTRAGGLPPAAPPAARCPQCGRSVQADWAHCPSCGASLTSGSARQG